MGTKKYLFHVALVLSIAMGLSQGRSTDREPIKSTLSFFFDEDAIQSVDVSNVTWAHAANSIKELQAALANKKVMMIEADIVMGSLSLFSANGSSELIPIMAHPPTETSDMSFNDFLGVVIVNSQNGGKKGIKLDFKVIEAVEPCLKQLKERQKEIKFPVWLNADVLVGPVNATKRPIDGKQFLRLTNKYYPKGVLSLGWTTRFGNDDTSLNGPNVQMPIMEGEYESEHIKEMDNLLATGRENRKVTFPVRASLAAQSSDELLNLLGLVTDSTLTLFSSEDDKKFIDMAKLRKLMEEVHRNRIYVDLPFDPYNEEETPEVDPAFLDIINKDHTTTTDKITNDTNDTTIVVDNSTSSGDLLRGRGLQVVVLMLTIFIANYC